MANEGGVGEEEGDEGQLCPAGQLHGYGDEPQDQRHTPGLQVCADYLQSKEDAREAYSTGANIGPLVQGLGQSKAQGYVEHVRAHGEHGHHVEEVATAKVFLETDGLPDERRHVVVKVEVTCVVEGGLEEPLPLPLEPNALHADAGLVQAGPAAPRPKEGDDVQPENGQRDGIVLVGAGEVLEEVD